MYVCLCRAITASNVKELAREGVTSAEDLIRTLELDDESCCGFCMRNIQRIVVIAEEEAAAMKRSDDNSVVSNTPAPTRHGGLNAG